jgi:REP element-mobilizing transposase RayT
MAKTLCFLNIHFVFSTKNRQETIDESIKNRLWAYMGGVAKQNNMIPQAVGGTSNHVHLLLSLPPTISVAKAMQLIKTNSSKWLNEEYPYKKKFAWQSGYGAFSVGMGRLTQTIEYIDRQEEHHQKKTFEEEYIGFLKINGIEYDKDHVWG